MSGKVILYVFIVNYVFLNEVHSSMHLDMDSERFPLDRRIVEEALDPELCRRQISYLAMNNSLLFARFLDAGIRIPRGILLGNTVDYGNFHQCLAINEKVEDMAISGKYCRIRVPINQRLRLPNSSERHGWFDPNDLILDEDVSRSLEGMDLLKNAHKAGLPGPGIIGRIGPQSSLPNVSFTLAICIPRPCTTEQAINGLLFNLTNIGFEYRDVLCRLPEDRPWVAADYVAIVVFSAIGFLTLISTSYDLYQTMYLKRGDTSQIYTSFSVYTNTRRLLTFNSSPETLECLDGIRVLAMIWVLLGHSFSTVTDAMNPIDMFMWAISRKAIWLTGILTVDTFFFLSGLLLVYTTVGKIGPMQLLKNLPVFYLNRLLRVFPILAAVILFESSLYMRVSDGPLWDVVATQAYKCREFWWTTLLHVQNFVNPTEACIGVTWYLAIDVQLHILSPLILFWVLASKRAAWTAINVGLFAILAASTAYIFVLDVPSGIIPPNRLSEMQDYFIYYYVNILTRASPFFVGMLYGYLLHSCRKNNSYIPRMLTAVLLLCSFVLLLVIMYCSHIAMTLEWDNHLADNFFNSFLRPLWALALGWIIFACVQGVAEPINWFLSLRMWKLPARISYAIYITHFSIMVAFYSTPTVPIYFSVPSILMNFLIFLTSTLVLSFFVTLLIDSPFATIFKLILGSPKKPQPKITTEEASTTKESTNGILNNDFTHDEDATKNRVLNSNLTDQDLKLNMNPETNKTVL